MVPQAQVSPQQQPTVVGWQAQGVGQVQSVMAISSFIGHVS
ncbi:MAG: hypothetical protein AAGF02_13430 [Actinomycetota bacterium]